MNEKCRGAAAAADVAIIRQWTPHHEIYGRSAACSEVTSKGLGTRGSVSLWMDGRVEFSGQWCRAVHSNGHDTFHWMDVVIKVNRRVQAICTFRFS